MGKKIVFALCILISLILLDIFSRFLYEQSWFSSFRFSKDLDPFDVITLVCTSLLTIWLGWYVSRKITEQRYEKEYIITDLKRIEEEINQIEKSMESSSIELQTLLNLLIKLKTNIDRFSKTVEIFNISCIEAKSLESFYTNLYKKTTNLEGTFLPSGDPIRNEINQVCADFVIKTREMIFKVNKD